MLFKILGLSLLMAFSSVAQDATSEQELAQETLSPVARGKRKMSREEKKQRLNEVFSMKNLAKLLLSERQDEIVDDYLIVFDNVTEEQIIEQLNTSLQGSPLKFVIKPNSALIRLYARAHKDDEILKGIFGVFKDRKDFSLFVAANILIFGLNYWRKKKNKEIQGATGFFKKTSLFLIMLFIQYVMIMYFFGENFKPAIRAYKQIQRSERYG